MGKACSRFTGTVGIDDTVRNAGPEGGTPTFQVVGDGGYNGRADWAARQSRADVQAKGGGR
ncbi:NPCBM/NEW2 domain-containing protein [Kribbella qitaiheensis]|uniref:NPCBM/NEW2 domain-containing protein n=1 Tax=Kribbella qitaiheensis TaxID=1544730 RepID=UPI003D18D315